MEKKDPVTPFFKMLGIGIAIIILLSGAIGSDSSLGYNYFQLLRLITSLTAILIGWGCFKKDSLLMGFSLWFLACIFNPIYPITMQILAWHILDIAAALMFFPSFKKNAVDWYNISNE